VEGDAKNSYWNENAQALLTAILLWQVFTQKVLTGMVTTAAFSGAIRENAAAFVDMAPETYSGVISNLGRYTKFMSDPQIKAATGTSSFSMADMTGAGKARPMTPRVKNDPGRHLCASLDGVSTEGPDPEPPRQG
jgi:type IV secretory pathway TraG/TraD family ATPase VirD4